MMLLSKQSFLHSLMLACIGTHAAFFYPDPQASLLEHILVDTHGAHASGFASAITPCTNVRKSSFKHSLLQLMSLKYVSGAQTLGRETAAQWIRVAFHDFVTAHVAEGTGGVDASIGFETLREEDSGSAMNDSLGFFRPYVNSKISSKLQYPALCHSSCADLSSISGRSYRHLSHYGKNLELLKGLNRLLLISLERRELWRLTNTCEGRKNRRNRSWPLWRPSP
jgi:hypothetical protein